MDKVVATAREAVADVPEGASPAVGGCGLSGAMKSGLAVLLAAGRIARVTGSCIAPVEAVDRTLAKAGREWNDLSVLEPNEAFAAQVLGSVAERPEFDPSALNPQGGAIAHRLARRGGGVRVTALCIGVGQGLALVLER